MDSTKMQAQVRGLTRDVGALREALREEEKKRERLAARAKAADEARAAAEARNKQLTYVNTKLEQELRSAKERGDATAAKARAGVEALRGRLGEVERGVHQRSVDAQQVVQRLRAAVQELQGTAMPLAVAAAAGEGPGPGAALSAAAAALKSPLAGGATGAARAMAARRAKPEQLHRGFAQVLAGLNQLASIFCGDAGDGGAAVSNPAPMLLTAPNGSTRAVHWQDQNSPANSAASTCAASGCTTSQAATAAAAAAAAQHDAEKQRIVAEVQRLRGALAEARQQAAAAASSAATSSGGGAASGSRVEAAMKQLDAVVPQYRAAAQALQGQVATLKQQLTAAARERAAMQEEVGKWRGAAQRHEAALAEAAAQLHTREAQSLAATSLEQGQSDRLQGEAAGLRRRCAELAARLQEAQRAVAQLQGALAAKEKLSAAQQHTIQQLEGTIKDQQADIRAALALVSGRPAAGTPAAAAALGGDGLLAADEDAELYGYAEAGAGLDDWQCGISSTAGWEAAFAAAGEGAESAALGGGGALPGQARDAAAAAAGGGQLECLLEAAADAAAAWAGCYDDGGSGAAGAYRGVGEGNWYDAEDDGGWRIPSVAASPLQPAAAGAAAGRPCAAEHHAASGASSLAASPAAARSLQVTAAPLETNIQGLEAALRSALADLSL